MDQLPVRQLEEEEDVYSTDRSGWSSSSSSYRDPCEESPNDVSQRLIIPERSPAGPTRGIISGAFGLFDAGKQQWAELYETHSIFKNSKCFHALD